MSKTTQNILLLLGGAVLALLPFALHVPAPEKFTGADGQAEELITQMHPEYAPWFSSLWEPPSGEVESMLFSLQAAIGSGLLFYYIGYRRGRKTAAGR